MTNATEDDFQALLDADPADHQTRQLFADWLDDYDDPRADGYRALGQLQAVPVRNPCSPGGGRDGGNCWHYTNAKRTKYLAEMFKYAGQKTEILRSGLPECWCGEMEDANRRDGPKYTTPDPVMGDFAKAVNWNSSSGWFGYAPTRRDAEDAAALAYAALSESDRREINGDCEKAEAPQSPGPVLRHVRGGG